MQRSWNASRNCSLGALSLDARRSPRPPGQDFRNSDSEIFPFHPSSDSLDTVEHIRRRVTDEMQMKKEWPKVRLGEVLTQDQQYVLEPEARSYPKLSVKLYGKGVVLDSPTDGSTLKMKRHQLARAGQVILSEIWGKKGAIGLVPPEGEGALCTSHFFLFDVRSDKVAPEWLQAIFAANYLQEQLDAEAKGTTGYAAVRPKMLLECEIPLPPLVEQRRVVARIEKMAAQIHEASTLHQQAVEERDALLGSAIRSVASGVEATGRLGDILDGPPRNGWSARCDNAEGGTPVLSLGAVTGFRYRSTEFKRTSLHASEQGHFWLRPGDLLITRSNTPALVGHVAIYDGAPAPCIYPDLMMRLNVQSRHVERRFVWYWLQSPLAREFINRNAKGTSPTMKKISQGVVMAIPFPTGLPIPDQRRIVSKLDALQAEMDALRHLQAGTAAELGALLHAVLDHAFKGEL